MTWFPTHALRGGHLLLSLFLVSYVWIHKVSGCCSSDGYVEKNPKTQFYCSVDLKLFDSIEGRDAKFCQFLVIRRALFAKGKLEYNVTSDFHSRLEKFKKENDLKLYIFISVHHYAGYNSTFAFQSLLPLLNFYDGFIWDSPAEKQDLVDLVAKKMKAFSEVKGKTLLLYDAERAEWTEYSNCYSDFAKYFDGVILHDMYGTRRLSSRNKDFVEYVTQKSKQYYSQWKSCNIKPAKMIQEVIYDHTESGYAVSSRDIGEDIRRISKDGGDPRPPTKFDLSEYKGIIDREEFVKIGKEALHKRLKSFLVPFHLVSALATDITSGPILDVAVHGLTLGNYY